mgnify:CR=1 FL=1
MHALQFSWVGFGGQRKMKTMYNEYVLYKSVSDLFTPETKNNNETKDREKQDNDEKTLTKQQDFPKIKDRVFIPVHYYI